MRASRIPHPCHAAGQSVDEEPDLGPRWRLGLLTDPAGHIHVGALFPSSDGAPPVYKDLLAPIGAGNLARLDLERFSVIVHGEHVADLRRIILECIDDPRLKQRLLELLSLAIPRS